VDGGFFSASYQTRNFLGRGNLVTLNGQIGGVTSRYVISLTEPYFLGRPITAGFSVFRREQDYSDFQTSGTGASVTLGRRFRTFQSVNALLLHENTDFDPTDGLSSSATVNSIRPTYTYDTRNSFIRPTRGMQFLVSTEYAGGALGGDTSFIKPLVEFQVFRPIYRNHYLAFKVEAGYVTAIGSNILPTYERYFLGGERTMRNFGTRSVSPTGFICNFGLSEAVESLDDCPAPPRGFNHTRNDLGFFSESVGGDRNILVNVEYVVPLTEPVDFLLYLDAGNAFAEWESWSADLIRGDYGAEVRFFLPVFGAPLRLIWGHTFNTTGDEDTREFLFSIGRTF
jgi:outer membrane protein insertion porin family